MKRRGRNINFFLMDGSSTGRIKCTLANWTGVAYKIPRTDLDLCKERADLKQSGVYFLFGTSDRTDENVVYIGQAGVRKNGEGILCRLQEHKRDQNSDYWTEAVVFTTSNNSFGPTEISYLENSFCKLAVGANRYTVKNGNDPSPGHTTEEKKSELEDFLENAKVIMGTLGYKIFEPYLKNRSQEAISDLQNSSEEIKFYLKRSGTDASCSITSEGVVLLKDSKIRTKLVPSCPDSVKAARNKYSNLLTDEGTLLQDLLFRTPSGAAAFVLGAPANGNIEWKTENGTCMKDADLLT